MVRVVHSVQKGDVNHARCLPCVSDLRGTLWSAMSIACPVSELQCLWFALCMVYGVDGRVSAMVTPQTSRALERDIQVG